MRFGSAVLLALFVLSVKISSPSPAALAQNVERCSAAKDAEYLAHSTPIIKAWEKVPVGSPIFALDDAAGTKGWLDRATAQLVDFQSGIWNIDIERGYSVFRIYPDLSKDDTHCVFQGIVVKVNGNLTVDDLLTAIRSRNSSIKIDSYDVFSGDSVGVQRYSRKDTRAIRRHL